MNEGQKEIKQNNIGNEKDLKHSANFWKEKRRMKVIRKYKGVQRADTKKINMWVYSGGGNQTAWDAVRLGLKG